MELLKEKEGVSAPERSGGAETPSSKFDAEVKPCRRRFSESYKARILSEIDKCDAFGSIGLILRREGLYASQLSQWRKAMKSNNKPKVTSRNLKNENDRLKRKNNRLQAKLVQSQKIIEIQKKMAEFAASLETENSGENLSK